MATFSFAEDTSVDNLLLVLPTRTCKGESIDVCSWQAKLVHKPASNATKTTSSMTEEWIPNAEIGKHCVHEFLHNWRHFLPWQDVHHSPRRGYGTPCHGYPCRRALRLGPASFPELDRITALGSSNQQQTHQISRASNDAKIEHVAPLVSHLYG